MCSGSYIDGLIDIEFKKLARDMRMHLIEYLLTNKETKNLHSIEELEEQYKLEVKK